MKLPTKTVPALAGALLLTLLATACSTSNPATQKVALHPIQETRMSDKPLPGYVPTGAWRVKGRSGNVVYLLGTCHVTPDSEIPFPSSYYAAYHESRDVFFEIDDDSLKVELMALYAAPGMIGFLLDHSAEMESPQGQTLSNSLSPKTVKLLRAHYGSAYADKEHLSPLGLLVSHEMGDGLGTSGVDDLFTLLAHRDHKTIRALESVSTAASLKPVLEYCVDETRNDIAKKGADAAVREAILKRDTSESNWRYGISDRDAAEEFADMKKNRPEVYQMLLPRRNQQWMAPITRAIEGKRTTAVFVGALHFPGPDGLLESLRRQGYHPEQMYGVDRPKHGTM